MFSKLLLAFSKALKMVSFICCSVAKKALLKVLQECSTFLTQSWPTGFFRRFRMQCRGLNNYQYRFGGSWFELVYNMPQAWVLPCRVVDRKKLKGLGFRGLGKFRV